MSYSSLDPGTAALLTKHSCIMWKLKSGCILNKYAVCEVTWLMQSILEICKFHIKHLGMLCAMFFNIFSTCMGGDEREVRHCWHVLEDSKERRWWKEREVERKKMIRDIREKDKTDNGIHFLCIHIF